MGSTRRCTGCPRPVSRDNANPHGGACAAAPAHRQAGLLMLPAGFVMRPEVRAALAVGNWSSVLQAVARVSGAPQTAIAAAAGVSQSQVSRLMSGRHTQPSVRTIRGLCDALGIPRHLAGLTPVAAEPQEASMDVIAGTLDVLTPSVPMPACADGRAPNVGLDDARRLQSLAAEILQLDTTSGGDHLRETAIRTAGHADRLLQHGHYPEHVGRELHATLTELSELAGWVHYDAGQQQQARYWYQQALTHAQLIEDPRRELVVLSSLSMQSTHLGRAREAVQFAQRGQTLAAGWAPPRVRTLMLLREAAGWARAGQRDQTHRLLVRARTVYDPTRHDDDPPWARFLDDAELGSIEAACISDLGDHARAEAAFHQALTMQRGAFPRNEMFFRVRLAEEQHAQGNTRDTCAQLTDLIPQLTTLGSSRLRRRAVTLVQAVRREPSTAAADLADRARAAGLVG